jgi:hypothetical protein
MVSPLMVGAEAPVLDSDEENAVQFVEPTAAVVAAKISELANFAVDHLLPNRRRPELSA